jgi:anti-sigma B factor antagonist
MGTMTITERRHDDVVILDIEGKILLGEGDVQLREAIRRLLQSGVRKILLNLANVPYMDSAGLGELVRAYTTVRREGGELKLLNLTARIQDLLTITKLISVFESFDSEEEALKSFAR